MSTLEEKKDGDYPIMSYTELGDALVAAGVVTREKIAASYESDYRKAAIFANAAVKVFRYPDLGDAHMHHELRRRLNLIDKNDDAAFE